MFQAWEEWDFVTATYFSFITLTTVGFGDYTPDNSMKNALKQGATFSDWVQMILCLIYLMFGKSMKWDMYALILLYKGSWILKTTVEAYLIIFRISTTQRHTP